MTIEIGSPAPDFSLKNQHGEDVVLSELKGRNVALVFFPFAFSGICTGELCEIRDNIAAFADDDVEVLAVSCDHFFSNRAFADAEGLAFSVLSDFWPHGEVSRAYGIFNVLVLHKIADLDMAGDQNSKMASMARSLLADADVKVIYRQDRSALKITTSEMELSDRERSLVRSLPKGTGLWRLGDSSFEVQNVLTRAELPLFDTDERMDKAKEAVA